MNIHPKNAGYRKAGFTLAELILALSVMSVILAAAATLAFAMSSAESATNKMGEKQARLRFSTMRVRELARNSCMVFTTANGVVFWKDDVNGDGQINGNEITILKVDAGSGTAKTLKLTELPDVTDSVQKDQLQDNVSIDSLVNSTDEQTMLLFEDCTSASVSLDNSGKVVTVDFTITENNQIKEYQICGMIRASADYLLTPANDMISGDDDL